MNVPDELYNQDTFWDLYNKPWLDEAIRREDDIVLATKPEARYLSYIDRYTREEVITGFGKEYAYLLKKGYFYDELTKTMVLK